MTAELAPVLERLAAALERPAIPLEHQLWTADDVAHYLAVGARTVSESYSLRRGFPAAITLSMGGTRSVRRWKAAEVIAWAERQREKTR